MNEFVQRAEVKKSNVGKTIAISLLSFFGAAAIAALVVSSHGLALPLVPLIIAKAAAIGSAAGLSGIAVDSKNNASKQEKIKSTLFSFFKPSKPTAVENREDNLKKKVDENRP
ncbi:MAG: hypothetical protein NTU49_05515 [Gammaproteobacteria bacterium]|nr:hypothetical protein [Gammaproteobacteria bacterium]